MNIPMYNAMRRCVPIASLIIGPCIYPQRTTTSIVGAIILITAGTITAANGDLDFDVKSYSFGICSVLSQVIWRILRIIKYFKYSFKSLYLLTLQRMGAEQQLGAYNTASAKTLTILYVNSVNCVPILFVVVLLSGEFRSLLTEYAHWDEPGFLFALTVVTSFACVFRFECIYHKWTKL